MLELGCVLVVDDREDIVTAVRRFLRPARVVGTTKAVEAVEMARRESPQLALIDVYMPDRSGLEVVADLRREFPSLVIGVMSGKLTTDVAMDSIRASATWFIQKPFTRQKLVDEIMKGGAPLAVPRRDKQELIDLSLESAKWNHLQEVLAMSGGNKSAAARKLGLKRPSLQQMLRKGPPPGQHLEQPARQLDDRAPSDDD